MLAKNKLASGGPLHIVYALWNVCVCVCVCWYVCCACVCVLVCVCVRLQTTDNVRLGSEFR
jgi:hypothetical protein